MSTKSLLPVIAAALLGSVFPAMAQQPGADFPEGAGKAPVQAICGGCHEIGRLTAGYTPEGWRTVVRMMQNFGAPIPADQVATITDYLTKSFPEKPRPAAVIVPGPVEVNIKQFKVPTPGSRPHDPATAKDGTMYYASQLANQIGHVNPATGEIKEYKVNPQTGPHSLIEDNDGNVWYTGNFAGLIGKLDPKTGAVTEYKIPAPGAKDPHTIIKDKEGTLWFTAQVANKVGRINPKTGEIKIVTPPTANARPYGMAVNSKNEIYFVEFGTNKIATIDRNTMDIKEFTLPDPGARPRRISIATDDTIYYSDYARGYLGHLDPATGKVEEWQSPSGPKSQPYGQVFTKGAVWYNESGAKPNTIVRFDPQTKKFQSWAIPGGGDIVRNMVVNRDGNPITANSLVNEVGIVDIKGATN